jgi:hypothetical protein
MPFIRREEISHFFVVRVSRTKHTHAGSKCSNAIVRLTDDIEAMKWLWLLITSAVDFRCSGVPSMFRPLQDDPNPADNIRVRPGLA